VKLFSYLDAVRSAANKTASASSAPSLGNVSSGRLIIALSLNSSEPRMTWGAIRNAQLVKVHLPDWRLRVYVPSGDESTDENTSTARSSTALPPAVKPRVVATLQRLGAEVIHVAAPDKMLRHPPLSVLLSDPDVDYVLLRRAEWRLGEREAAAVKDWIHAAISNNSDAAIVHCLHDSEKHAAQALVDGLWGFRPAALRRRLTTKQIEMAISQLDNSDIDGAGLDRVIWPHVADAAYCHDSVATCFVGHPAGSSRPFPVERRNDDSFVGQRFDENQDPVEDENETTRHLRCSNSNRPLLTTENIRRNVEYHLAY
jgi:hypothetical protein